MNESDLEILAKDISFLSNILIKIMLISLPNNDSQEFYSDINKLEEIKEKYK